MNESKSKRLMPSVGNRAMLVLLALAFAIGLAPMPAIADTGAGGNASAVGDYTGTVYISVSYDDKYLESDGDISGQYMAYVPVSLSDVAAVDLDAVGLGNYYYTEYRGATVQKDVPNVMKLFVYAQQQYYSGKTDGFNVTGSSHSSFMKGFWGWDENLLYYVNGAYPLDSSLGEGMGATSDAIELHDGDFVDVSGFTNWSFYSDPGAGFHYFADEDGAITHEYTVPAGEDLWISVIKTSSDMGSAGESGGATPTSYSPVAGIRVRGGSSYGTSDASSVTTWSDGRATLNFSQSGTYYVWVDGQYGVRETKAIVSSPAIAKVTVTGWKRFSGDTRLETMAMANQEGFSNGSCSNIVLADAWGYADALAASAFAGAIDAPILTTAEDSLSDVTRSELKRLARSDAGSTTVWIVGGEAVVSQTVLEQVENMGFNVERIFGHSRVETGLELFDTMNENGLTGDTAIVATAWDFADSLSIGPWAYATRSPLFGATGGMLDSDQIAAIKNGGFSNVLILGGNSAVKSESVKAALGDAFSYTVLWGDVRTETSAKILQWTSGGDVENCEVGFKPDVTLAFDRMAVGDAWNFADPLPASGMLGRSESGILLVDDSTTTRGNIYSILASHTDDIGIGYILGGTSAVSEQVEGWLKQI